MRELDKIMAKQIDPVVNLPNLELEPFERGRLYQSLDARLGERLGLTQLGACYSEVPPGKSSCPFHVHHVEDEMFVILAGEGEYRFGGDTYPVKAGDVLGAPRGGPEYAHKLTNTGDSVLGYLCISSKSDIDVCEYPDSGKFMVSSQTRSGERRLRFLGRPADSLDYWDGEPTD